MDVQAKLELIRKNTEEIITEEELINELNSNKYPVTYCGYEPSGPLHLGHMITVTKLRDLEKAGFKVKILLADLHAQLNLKGDSTEIKDQCKIWEKAMLSLGLKNPEIILGSSFQLTPEYWKDIMAIATRTTMKRGLRSMQEIARDIENAKISQVLYPLMQTVDIKHLGVDVPEAGLEQRKIHMLAREVMPFINYKPPICVHTPLVTSLTGPGSKMSSSIPDSNISVIDPEKEVLRKIKKAYCPEGIVTDNPVLQLARLVVFPQKDAVKIERKPKFGGDILFNDYDSLEKAFVGKKLHPLDLKNAIGRELANIIAPIRTEYENLAGK
ncbi:MAG: tyrosine--tRNA ligase [Candidatus Hodarchaeales archaeon]